MLTTVTEQTVQTLEVIRDMQIAAPMDVVFETILEQMGPLNVHPDGTPLTMTLEAWPGGRWYRDLGDNNGHFWGNVQAIKRPTLLEISGPLFMSYAVVSNVQYRLSAEDGMTRVQFAHRAIGQISDQHRAGVGTGWGSLLTRIQEVAELAAAGTKTRR